MKKYDTWQSIFDLTIKQIMELLEVSNNDALKKAIKGKLFDLSDNLRERGFINYNREEETYDRENKR